ncbi:unnamed protein product [Peniophora sp. CBMAI 1063]|nr:unnamed protein product [Peniophora sp. CBMAI 1063]
MGPYLALLHLSNLAAQARPVLIAGTTRYAVMTADRVQAAVAAVLLAPDLSLLGQLVDSDQSWHLTRQFHHARINSHAKHVRGTTRSARIAAHAATAFCETHQEKGQVVARASNRPVYAVETTRYGVMVLDHVKGALAKAWPVAID